MPAELLPGRRVRHAQGTALARSHRRGGGAGLEPALSDPPQDSALRANALLFSESQLKDNPAFSMLNDSDDDVIYG